MNPFFPPPGTWCVALALVGLLAGEARAQPAFTGKPLPPEAECEVEKIGGIPYVEDGPTDRRLQLDLYLPKGRAGYPVLFFVHGGAWIFGDKNFLGVYGAVGRCLARQGIGVVLPNYRLWPGAKHPDQVRDVARAFAWTCRHIPVYGGRADQVFLGGHSAGGHLVSLLATDETYLRDEGHSLKDVRGVIPICGVYTIARADLGTAYRRWKLGRFVVEAGVNPFVLVFGKDPTVHREASPLTHVRPGLPPFLIVSAEHDLPLLPGMAERFHAALRDQQCEARLLRIPDRTHETVMWLAARRKDPVFLSLLEFIATHTRG